MSSEKMQHVNRLFEHFISELKRVPLPEIKNALEKSRFELNVCNTLKTTIQEIRENIVADWKARSPFDSEHCIVCIHSSDGYIFSSGEYQLHCGHWVHNDCVDQLVAAAYEKKYNKPLPNWEAMWDDQEERRERGEHIDSDEEINFDNLPKFGEKDFVDEGELKCPVCGTEIEAKERKEIKKQKLNKKQQDDKHSKKSRKNTTSHSKSDSE